MATTFVVEDGTGLATANAYVSEADADQYHENFSNPTAWSTATTAVKENAIRQATRYLDGTYTRRWVGYRGEKDQALDWPRRSAVDSDDWTRDSDSVPQEVKDACAILALEFINDSTLFFPNVSGEDKSIKRERVQVGRGGDILEDKTYAGTKRNHTVFSTALAVLRPLLVRRGQKIRG